jgi:hypothetical protein
MAKVMIADGSCDACSASGPFGDPQDVARVHATATVAAGKDISVVSCCISQSENPSIHARRQKHCPRLRPFAKNRHLSFIVCPWLQITPANSDSLGYPQARRIHNRN